MLNRAILYALSVPSTSKGKTYELLSPLQLCLGEWLLAVPTGMYKDLVAFSVRVLSELAGEGPPAVAELNRIADSDDTYKEIIKDDLQVCFSSNS